MARKETPRPGPVDEKMATSGLLTVTFKHLRAKKVHRIGAKRRITDSRAFSSRGRWRHSADVTR